MEPEALEAAFESLRVASSLEEQATAVAAWRVRVSPLLLPSSCSHILQEQAEYVSAPVLLAEQAEEACELGSSLILDSGSKLAEGVLSALRAHLASSPDAFRSCARRLANTCLEPLGDLRTPLRELATRLLLDCLALQVHSHESLFEALAPAWAHKNGRLREEARLAPRPCIAAVFPMLTALTRSRRSAASRSPR
jgi:hypothetical protein